MGKRQIVVVLGGGVPQTFRFKSHPFLASGNLENWGKKIDHRFWTQKGKISTGFFVCAKPLEIEYVSTQI